jgi:pyridoxamine--pyruvate transaminase
MVAISSRAWTHILANPTAPRDSYLSIIDWKVKWRDEGRFPFTPSVSDVYGVESVLDQVLEEGLDNSYRRHAHSAKVTRVGAVAMGLKLWPASVDISANCLTTIALPDSVNDVEMRTHIREHYGVMLSSGQGAGNLLRIAHMGPSASGMYPVVGLAAVGQGLIDKGISGINLGAGIDAAMSELARNGGFS